MRIVYKPSKSLKIMASRTQNKRRDILEHANVPSRETLPSLWEKCARRGLLCQLGITLRHPKGIEHRSRTIVVRFPVIGGAI